MTDRYAARRERLFAELPGSVSAAVLPAGRPLRYFTGIPMTVLEEHHGSERSFLCVLPRDGEPAVVTVSVEAGRLAGSSIAGAETYVYEPGADESPAIAAREAFESVCADRGLDGSVAVPFGATRLLDYVPLAGEFGWDAVVDLEPTYDGLRAQKDASEMAALRQAGEITDECLAAAFAELEPGATERDVETGFKRAAVESEADGWGVTLVASGERSAEVFSSTTDREIQAGDPVLIDTGVVYDGYYTDVTRTVTFGEPTDEYREMYAAAREANQAMRDATAVGVSLGELDQAGWRVIEEHGYGGPREGAFGHGIGVDPHEPPYIDPESEVELTVGHAITVEPGVYIDGVGGVRIEDDILLTEDGPEVISNFPRELQVY